MFSGIIEDLAAVSSVKPTEQGVLLRLRTGLPIGRIRIGDSIAVNGACLTVVAKSNAGIAMEVSAETLRRTALGTLAVGERVNLERSLTLSRLLNGHLVQGHIDAVGRIVAIKPEGDSRLFTFEVPPAQARYLIEKGSVAIDGVSLTTFGLRGRRFHCELIPHTLKMTTLGRKGPGALVNVESDMLAKYIERFVTQTNPALRGRRNGRVTAIAAAGYGGES